MLHRRLVLIATAIAFVPLLGCHSKKSSGGLGDTDASTDSAYGTTDSTSGNSGDSTTYGDSSSPLGCGLVTCASSGAKCGPIGDGCGGVIDCGSCTAPKTCGGGGTLFQCGGNSGCVPKTCSDLGLHCGPAGDGCGGKIDSCGSCTLPETCGGAGSPGVCGQPTGGAVDDAGEPVGCTKRTCAQAGATCGPVANGCGGLLNCGSCTAPQTCGGGGVAYQCGGDNSCVPRTCQQMGFNCGAMGDGCGGVIQSCGTCNNGNICGGGGTANVCGGSATGGSNCPGGGSTKISGTVVTGTDPSLGFGNPDPVFNAHVFVPSGSLQPITTGASCDRCTTSQPALVSAVTDIDGSFELLNPPSGNQVVVIQLGKWRRVINVNVTACVNNQLTTAQTRLPRTHGEGNIPRIAMSTGNVDAMECVLRKMGIADTEFQNPALDSNGNPTSAGRVHVYQATTSVTGADRGARIDTNSPKDDQLYGTTHWQTTLNAYDAVIFACVGARDEKDNTYEQHVISYADAGGRVFATHFSYVWLYDQSPWGCGSNTTCTSPNTTTAAWHLDQHSYPSVTGFIDQSFPKGASLANWLNQSAVGASTTLGQIPVNVARNDFDSLTAGVSQRWMYTQNPPDAKAFPLHFTFNTPAGASAANQCGRVVFSDFHVEDTSALGTKDVTFPTECTGGPLTPQEKLLEFMLLDLTSCVTPDNPPPPSCTPRTCQQLGASCGVQGNGCGGTIDCGTCTPPQTCGGAGVPNQCGGCVPQNCDQQLIECGPAGDGCGGTIASCGSCDTGKACGGGGVPGVCGVGACTPRTCSAQGISCGPAGDGCGNLIQCGPCTPPQTCGGGGTPGVCGAPQCTPRTCQQAGANCGIIGDGCGGTANCGVCPAGQYCGGAGIPNVCGTHPPIN